MKAKALFETHENENALHRLEGFRYQPDLIDAVAESALLAQIRVLPFSRVRISRLSWEAADRLIRVALRLHGTWSSAAGREDAGISIGLRRLAATFANLEPASLEQTLVTEYRRGAGIGWHRDKPVFGQVVGVSLLAPCVIRFRRKSIEAQKNRPAWERVNVVAQSRSAYLLSGPSRFEWEHSIAGVNELRYSITFRSLR